MLESSERAQLVSLLAWYGEMGIDAVLAEQPVDWSERPGAAPGEAIRSALREIAAGAGARDVAQLPARLVPQNAGPGAMAGRQLPGAPLQRPAEQPKPLRDPVTASARKAVAAVTSLSELRAALESFEGCALKATARNTCLYRGAERARLMIIGEAPGRDEDLAGKPFVGRAGQLLDRMLAAIDLSEEDVHITNIVYWRPPGNRTPTPQEALICRPFLDRQIRLVEPQMILVLGGAAAKSLLGVNEGIMKLRGKWKQVDIGGVNVPALASLHPAYLLRTPAAKRLAWRDLLAVRAALASRN